MSTSTRATHARMCDKEQVLHPTSAASLFTEAIHGAYPDGSPSPRKMFARAETQLFAVQLKLARIHNDFFGSGENRARTHHRPRSRERQINHGAKSVLSPERRRLR